jgi:hypothetical protein
MVEHRRGCGESPRSRPLLPPVAAYESDLRIDRPRATPRPSPRDRKDTPVTSRRAGNADETGRSEGRPNSDTVGEFVRRSQKPTAAVPWPAHLAQVPADRPPPGIRQQDQHSCYEGQSSEPKTVNLGSRGGRGPSVRLPKISLLRPALRNHPHVQVVPRSLTPDSASFASSFAYSAKC